MNLADEISVTSNGNRMSQIIPITFLAVIVIGCQFRSARGSEVKSDGDVCSAVVLPQPALHRLSNTEYDLTVRDLLGTSMSFTGLFPPDQTSEGFDTAAGAHSVSPVIFQSYLDAANQLAAEYSDRSMPDCRDGQDLTCVNSKLLEITEKAYRRPFYPGEADRMLAFVDDGRANGLSTKDAFTNSLAGALVSPQFLFRKNVNSAEIENQDQFALASRLSYFLWSSMPDDRLLDLAKSGKLKDQKILREVVTSMAKDAKAIGFIRNFAGQWLGTNKLAIRAPAPPLDSQILEDFQTEMLSFVSEFIRRNLSVRELLDADFTYVNSRLAKWYGIKTSTSDFERVTVKDGSRSGLLSKGAFLIAMSNPSSTSPVRRGKWVLDNLLCASPPPAPPGVDLSGIEMSNPNVSMREKLSVHSTKASCKACHEAMDSIGLALENYDHHAQWRDSDPSGEILTYGTLHDGTKFSTTKEMIDHIKVSYEFPRCVARKLATYALGRLPSGAESCVLDQIAKRAESPNYGLRDMVVDISVELLSN